METMIKLMMETQTRVQAVKTILINTSPVLMMGVVRLSHVRSD